MAKPGAQLLHGRTLARMTATLERLNPDSPEAKATMFRIGTMLRNAAIGNLTRSGAVNFGRLRASISFQIETNGQLSRLTVGAFGIRYARMVELGGAFTEQMRRAMFASFAAMGMKPRASKGVIRGGYYRARPYLGPALRDAIPEIRAQFAELVNGPKDPT